MTFTMFVLSLVPRKTKAVSSEQTTRAKWRLTCEVFTKISTQKM